MSPDKLRKKHIVRSGMRLSIIEGIYARIYSGLCMIGSGFITKFLVILGATPLQFSLLSALGQVAAIFEPLGLVFTHHLSRRKWACIWLTAAGRILTMFIGVALFFSLKHSGIWFVLALLFLASSLQAAGANIWIAWMSDLIPLKIRGRFFSRRNQIHMLAGMIIAYVVSMYVDMFESTGGTMRRILVQSIGLERWFVPQNQAYFLALMFVLATLIGLVGLLILARQPERPLKKIAKERLRDEYTRPFKDPNFRRLLVFGIWWMLAIGVGSAFWGPFMLKNLGMGMFKMQLYGTLHSFASLITFLFWGRFIDRFGNKSAMKICVVLGGLNPMLWLLTSPTNYNILWLEAIISGTMWAGNALVTTNFVLAIAPQGKQQIYSGIYNAIAGVSMMCSTLLSGIFFPAPITLAGTYLQSEQVIFAVGGILRWITIIPLMFVVEKNHVPLRLVFSNGLRYAWGNAMNYWQTKFKRPM